MQFGFMNVMSLYSDHQYFEATCVISSGTKIYILELTTLKMTTWVVETGWWSQYNKITFIKPKCICLSFNKFDTSY